MPQQLVSAETLKQPQNNAPPPPRSASLITRIYDLCLLTAQERHRELTLRLGILKDLRMALKEIHDQLRRSVEAADKAETKIRDFHVVFGHRADALLAPQDDEPDFLNKLHTASNIINNLSFQISCDADEDVEREQDKVAEELDGVCRRQAELNEPAAPVQKR